MISLESNTPNPLFLIAFSLFLPTNYRSGQQELQGSFQQHSGEPSRSDQHQFLASWILVLGSWLGYFVAMTSPLYSNPNFIPNHILDDIEEECFEGDIFLDEENYEEDMDEENHEEDNEKDKDNNEDVGTNNDINTNDNDDNVVAVSSRS